MKFFGYLTLLAAFVVAGCGNDENTAATTAAENDVDAARSFIRCALDGRWKDARRLILQDSANLEDLDVAEQNYTQRLGAVQQREYREAQIRIYDTRRVSDSESIVIYSNTVPRYKDRRDSLRVVRQGNAWLVDLKYSFPEKAEQP